MFYKLKNSGHLFIIKQMPECPLQTYLIVLFESRDLRSFLFPDLWLLFTLPV